MKRAVVLLLVFSLMLTFSACASFGGEPMSSTVDNTTVTTPADTTVLNTTSNTTNTDKVEPPEEKRLNYTDVKAMWISQFDLNEVYGGDTQRSEADFKNLVSKMMQNVASIGVNTVIIQVRPNGDSIYPSEYYAPSRYVVGAYGNDFTYDPFEIIVEEAHKCELSVHAWINPMRAMTTTEIESIDSKYQLKKWWDDPSDREAYLAVVSSRVYLDVGMPAVRELIVNGAREILEKYDVDGLHMDDYFYPTTDASFDEQTYAAIGRGELADWRRDNVNLLVEALYSMTKSVNSNILFGISPAGNLDNNFNALYADVYAWCGNYGYVDYICPQIYFGLEHGTHAFDKTATDWSEIIKIDGIDMWIGMTLEKAEKGSRGEIDTYAGTDVGKSEWINNRDVLKRCLEKTEDIYKCTGVAYFSYRLFWNSISGNEITETQTERNNFLPLLKTIRWN